MKDQNFSSDDAALAGLRVLDLSQYEAGPSCTQALALLGAEVVKVERPGGGDPGRSAFAAQPGVDADYFLHWNSNKQSLALALDRPEGLELFHRLVPRFDVVVENFATGVAARLGVDASTLRALHPGLIYASVKGFGESGPLADRKCFDAVAQAASGALSINGSADGPPLRMGATLGDCGAGMQLALAICAAYIQRTRTGRGQQIELSMQEALTYYLRTMIAVASAGGTSAVPRSGNRMGPLIDLFSSAGGGPNDAVYIMAVGEPMWRALCGAIDRLDLLEDERWSTVEGRREHVDALHEEIEKWTRCYDKFEAMRRLGEAGVPASAVYDTRDLFADPHLLERGFVHEVDHPTRGRLRLLGFAPRLSDSRVALRAAPLLGEHSAAVLAAELRLPEVEIEQLAEAGVIEGRRATDGAAAPSSPPPDRGVEPPESA